MSLSETKIVHFLNKITHNFGNVLIGVFLIGIATVTAYFIVYNYYEGIASAKEGVFRELKAIANTSAGLIDGDVHERITDEYKHTDQLTLHSDDSSFLQLHQKLKYVYTQNDLQSPVYTLIYNDSKGIFEFVATSSSTPYYRHAYERFPEKLMQDFDRGGVLDLYESENGSWLSAFAPIKNSDNEVVAVLEVDQNFRNFIMKARQKLLKQSIVSILLIIPFSFLLVKFQKQTISIRKEYEEELSEKNEEINIQNEVITKAYNELEKTKDRIAKHNITLEETVKQRTRKLLQSNRDLAGFLYHSSHDIQAPLASIKGLIHIGECENKPHPLNDHFKQSLTRLERMIRTVQSAYTIKTKKLKMQTLGLSTVLEKLRSEYNNEPIHFDFLGTDSISVKADYRLLHMALGELVKNSLQYREHKEEAKVTISVAYRSTEEIQLKVSDNGNGIPAAMVDRLFRKFKRGNEKSDGVGLGLYLTRSALLRMKGSIKFQNTDKPGATFVIMLKLASSKKGKNNLQFKSPKNISSTKIGKR